MNSKIALAARTALTAAVLTGMTGCCWMKCGTGTDCGAKKPCCCPDCSKTRRNVDVNFGAHAGTSGVGMDAGIDRK